MTGRLVHELGCTEPCTCGALDRAIATPQHTTGRRMSCSLTIEAVRARTKTVTRRHVDTWKTLKPGDRLTLIEKGMGLPKGSHQVVLAEVEVMFVSIIEIGKIDRPDLIAEGFPTMAWRDFIDMWCTSHGYPTTSIHVPCRRIEWRYLS